ncbi:hypothetical protein N7495_001974 [Penicillium taxi]|uniref:uncharacterized protein n=1 Tax=Penicillium taxi TaxID=168475 RepID=UPI00254577AD|nr:uncharacterized protein N7495_001974 [Penicillium taxi]KAJ5901446.1 hypothetical protein N7495_001974 [Penicillium taxi]
MLSACAIAASSVEKGFCSALTPNVTEEVFSFSFRYRGGCLSIATPNPTSPFRAELLVTIYINPAGIVGDCEVALALVYTRASHGANLVSRNVVEQWQGGPLPLLHWS